MEEKKNSSVENTDEEQMMSFLKKLKAFRKESPSACGNRNLRYYVRLMRKLSRGRSGQAAGDIPVYQLV